MKYYTEISHIVRGALRSDKSIVSAYTQQLIEKLSTDGEILAVKGLSDQLNSIGANTMKSASGTLNVSRPIPVEKDNRFSLADKTHPTVQESIVFLSDDNESTVDAFLSYLVKKDRLHDLGIPINPTLLLHGEPGTGKSKLANYLAAKLELPLVTARADALISSYLGSTSKNIRSLLEYAQSEPCVLFLDEFDAIAKARDDKNEIGELKRVVVSLLQNIDNLGDTILVAATNHVHLLDPAIGRRFHYKLELLSPKERERKSLLSALLSKFDFNNEGMDICVMASEGMTGAEIEMATYEYLRFSVINDHTPTYIGLLKELLLVMHPWLSFQGDDSKYNGIHKLKELNTELYTGKLLSKLWDISPSYVSRLLKEQK
ncbi:ATP-binding protein [Vibrio cortegadensis]|uniref:AAA family ATPase n=1 Tax=Vibrio cortegadensis TaxID=1328770 RepID=UPI0021C4001D|nr:ATP-binding protein [Vibrio cortegadensis]MDN3696985.1 ATP-binding protein [Vibrio cortegadensis]